MLSVILVVLFTMVMFLWLLGLLGANQSPPNALAATFSPWLAWFACLFLGIVVFLTGTGVIVWRQP